MLRTTIIVSSAFFLTLPSLGAQVRVVDLTGATPILAGWNIVASEAGGSVGTGPTPPSHVPVTVLLTACSIRNAELYFSVEIQNNRAVEVQIPVNTSSKPLDRPGTIAFRELLIGLGTATNTADPSTFKEDLAIQSIELFGNQAVAGTTAVLAPGERLLLLLKTQAPPKGRDLSALRVRIGGFDATLVPSGAGYRKSDLWVPALSAVSEPGCSDSKGEEK
ncbi:MAG: hypothetical protein WBL65_17725 [Bryobacteraceae bacterium]